MAVLKAVALQLMFGWDTITGLGAFALLSLAFDEPANVYVLLFAGFCAYLPDIDMIPFMLLRKRLGILTGHWVFFHHPPIVLPVVLCASLLGAPVFYPGHTAFITTLALVCVVGHFIHDASAKPGGFHLLSPFTRDRKIQFTLRQPWIWKHYRIGLWGIREESREDMMGIYEGTAWLASTGNELGGRTEVVTKAQLGSFGACVVSVLSLIMLNGLMLPF